MNSNDSNYIDNNIINVTQDFDGQHNISWEELLILSEGSNTLDDLEEELERWEWKQRNAE